jgi:hypothetical protein
VQAETVARPLVAGPRAQADAGRQAVGCFSSRAERKGAAQLFCQLFIMNFRSLFDDFFIVLMIFI